jgi:hypothetical protein
MLFSFSGLDQCICRVIKVRCRDWFKKEAALGLTVNRYAINVFWTEKDRAWSRVSRT